MFSLQLTVIMILPIMLVNDICKDKDSKLICKGDFIELNGFSEGNPNNDDSRKKEILLVLCVASSLKQFPTRKAVHLLDHYFDRLKNLRKLEIPTKGQ
ncbi:Hypothetical predicted protein [Podarcis lilfordi]|uniref:Interleukin-4 n=1 Tax=Podarcis lilfordi TaxID=74358 RepID=A0AA35K720_9SAUR|nr:Hypothetical predicted protein [Podarcis lilfordi]